MRTPLEVRFWPKVNRDGPVPDYRPELGPCWVWLASLNGAGYGQINRGDGRPVVAHRVSYELVVGPIPAGLQIDHLCRVPRCVNPDHLEPVTAQVNMHRGTSNASARLSPTCHKGHAWTDENTYWTKAGYRMCRACHRVRQAAYKAAVSR